MIDFSDPPPKRWIEGSLGGPTPGMVHISTLLALRFAETMTDPDERLALEILADAPAYQRGDNALNRYTHALWAHMYLDQDNRLPELLELINRVGRTLYECGITNLALYPVELFFMAAYANMRLDRTEEARLCLVLANRTRMNQQNFDDYYLLLEAVPGPDEDLPPEPQLH